MCPGKGCNNRTIEIWIGLCPGTDYNVQHCSLAWNHRYVCLYLCLNKAWTRLAHFDQFFNWFHGLSILLTDHPELRQTTQPSIMGGPLGDPGFCFFRSTDGPKHHYTCRSSDNWVEIEVNSRHCENFSSFTRPKMYFWHIFLEFQTWLYMYKEVGGLVKNMRLPNSTKLGSHMIFFTGPPTFSSVMDWGPACLHSLQILQFF